MTLEFRAAREGDASAVAELCNVFERTFSDDPELESEEDILRWWRRECEVRLVLDEGELVGVGYVEERRGDRWDGDGYVHPEAFGRGVGTAIVEWIEERARAHDSAETRIATLAQDERGACLLRSRGFAPVRFFFRMMIEPAEQPPVPSWPDGYVVATLHPGEERDLYEVHRGRLSRPLGPQRAHVRRVAGDPEGRPRPLLPGSRRRRTRGRCPLHDRRLRARLGQHPRHQARAPPPRPRRGVARPVLPHALRSRRAQDRSRRRRREHEPARPGSTSASACTSAPGSISTPRSCKGGPGQASLVIRRNALDNRSAASSVAPIVHPLSGLPASLHLGRPSRPGDGRRLPRPSR